MSSPATTSGRTRTTAANGVLALELIRGERIENEKNYQRMRKKRGGDTLPPPLSLAGYPDRRPIALFY